MGMRNAIYGYDDSMRVRLFGHHPWERTCIPSSLLSTSYDLECRQTYPTWLVMMSERRRNPLNFAVCTCQCARHRRVDAVSYDDHRTLHQHAYEYPYVGEP